MDYQYQITVTRVRPGNAGAIMDGVLDRLNYEAASPVKVVTYKGGAKMEIQFTLRDCPYEERAEVETAINHLVWSGNGGQLADLLYRQRRLDPLDGRPDRWVIWCVGAKQYQQWGAALADLAGELMAG